MANPNVDKLVGEFSNALERWFDRWKRAVDTARNGYYPFEQFAADVTETWVDTTYVAALPVSLFGGISLALQPPFPVLRFILSSKTDTSRLVFVPNLGSVTSMTSEHLLDASKANQIKNTNITLATVGLYLKVSLINLSTMSPMPPAGTYKGNVIGMPMNAPIARIEVEFP